jgi:hypothetical protein
MRGTGWADRFVIARENNVVRVDFRKPDPPAPHFPGAGALRRASDSENDFPVFEDSLRSSRLRVA